MNTFEELNKNESKNKRQQILDAAYNIFSRKGFYKTTVDEIIAMADTGKGTVYNYFVNKEQLFYTIVKEKHEPFTNKLKSIYEKDITPTEKINCMVRAFLEFYDENIGLWRALMHEIRALSPDGYSDFDEAQVKKYRQIVLDEFGILEDVLKQGIINGDFRQCSTTQASYGLLSAVIVMSMQDLMQDRTLEETATMITNTFLHGLATR